MELNDFWQGLLPGSPTHLRWPWLSVMIGAVLLGALVWWRLRPLPSRVGVLVSGTERLAALPRFRQLVRRRRARTLGSVAACVLATLGCLVLVARPATVTTYVDRPSRDVIVCLDVSGSMRGIDARVVSAVAEVVEALPGDRIGLTVFDGQAVTKFPLTDDRAYVASALEEAHRAFSADDRSYYEATDAPYRSSQLADGLRACLDGFDRMEERRGRAVLVATDNLPLGPSVHRLGDVADHARGRDVVVHALGAPWLVNYEAAAKELEQSVRKTGGSLSLLDEPGAVRDVVERIDRVERARLAEPPRQVVDDRPQSGALLTFAGLLLLALVGTGRRS